MQLSRACGFCIVAADKIGVQLVHQCMAILAALVEPIKRIQPGGLICAAHVCNDKTQLQHATGQSSSTACLCRKLFSGSLIGQGVCMLALAAGFAIPALKGISGAIALVFTIGYVGAFAFGTGPIPALFSSELFADGVRGALQRRTPPVRSVFP